MDHQANPDYNPAEPKVVQVPGYFRILKFVQIGLALLILALSAAAIGLLSGNGFIAGPGYQIFVAIATFFINGYYLFATIRAPHLYHKIPILVLEVFQFLWWLSSWTTLAYWAAWASVWVEDVFVSADGTIVSDGADKALAGVLGAAAFFAAVTWITFAVTMVVYIINMRKHGHAAANTSAVHVSQVTPNKMEQGHEMQYQQPPYGAQQQQYAPQEQQYAPQQQHYGGQPQPILHSQ